MHPKPLIIILGPTASGKSELALKLAREFNGEIINADSRQIYQEMDIGTNKSQKSAPSEVEGLKARPEQNRGIKGLPRAKSRGQKYISKGITHHLIDILKPSQKFTLAQYKKLAIKKIKEIQRRKKIPFLVGGTGLYIQAIVDNLKIPKVRPDKKLRDKLEKLTAQVLVKKLKKLDPPALEFINPHNKRRLIRAIEVCLKTKKPFSRQREKGQPLFNILQIGLKIPQEILDKRINRRLEKMFKAGLIKEVKNLLKKYSPDLPSMSGIGYQETVKYLNNEIDLAAAKELIKQHTRQYSRRQMTWFKKDKKIKWVKNYQKAQESIKLFLSRDCPERTVPATQEQSPWDSPLIAKGPKGQFPND